jgi:hypothetical protein
MHQETTAADTADTAPPQAVPPAFALFQMITGKFVSRAVYAAARLRLADLLADGPRTAAELAASTGNHAPSLQRLLRALAGLGVLSTIPGVEPRFALTPVGELLRDTPGSPRAMALWILDPRHDRAWDEIFHSLATGEPGFDQAYGMPVFDHFAHDPDFAAIFNDAMTSLSAATHPAVVAAYDFSGLHRLVDVGGGHGGLLAGILAANPRLSGIVYDLPHVIEGTRAALTAAGLEGRCRAEGGSFFERVPEGADGYILSFVLHDWDDERATAILRNVRQAMSPEGRVLVVEGLIPEGDEPSLSKLSDLEMLVMTSGGRERTAEEFGKLFAAAGLRLTRVVPTAGAAFVLEASI